MHQIPGHLSPLTAIKSVCAVPWKKMQQNNWTKAGWYQRGFLPGRNTNTTVQIFTLQKTFEKSWEYAKDVYTCFVDLKKAHDRFALV